MWWHVYCAEIEIEEDGVPVPGAVAVYVVGPSPQATVPELIEAEGSFHEVVFVLLGTLDHEPTEEEKDEMVAAMAVPG